jgi:hypothetical protein
LATLSPKDEIEKTPKPEKMSDAELARYCIREGRYLMRRIEHYRLYLLVLRERFRSLDGSKTILGCRTWNEFCTERLEYTKRAMNYMLAGGNKDAKKKKQLAAENDDHPVMTPWSTGRRVIEMQRHMETVAEILTRASDMLDLPVTDELRSELKTLIQSAIQTMTEALAKFGAIQES